MLTEREQPKVEVFAPAARWRRRVLGPGRIPAQGLAVAVVRADVPKEGALELEPDPLLLIGLGTGLGTLGALGLTRFLQTLLYQTSPTHITTFVSVTSVLAVVGVVASFIPAIRAAKVDPITALRVE